MPASSEELLAADLALRPLVRRLCSCVLGGDHFWAPEQRQRAVARLEDTAWSVLLGLHPVSTSQRAACRCLALPPGRSVPLHFTDNGKFAAMDIICRMQRRHMFLPTSDVGRWRLGLLPLVQRWRMTAIPALHGTYGALLNS